MRRRERITIRKIQKYLERRIGEKIVRLAIYTANGNEYWTDRNLGEYLARDISKK